MADGKVQWPQVGTKLPPDANAHATILQAQAQQIVDTISENRATVPAKLVLEILRSTIALSGKILNGSTNERIKEEILKAHRETLESLTRITHTTTAIKTDVTHLRHASVTLKSTPVTKNTGTTYAQALIAGATSIPPSCKPKTAAAPTIQPLSERQVIIKTNKIESAQSLRADTPERLCTTVNTAIQQSIEDELHHIKVLDTKQLPSGDILLHTATSAQAELLRQYPNADYLKVFGTGAEVLVPTYGVVVHSIRTKSMDMTNQAALIEKFCMHNATLHKDLAIKKISWLTPLWQAKTVSSIIIDFTKPESANKVLYGGIRWEHAPHDCYKYHREHRIRQCYRCQKYGHIGPQCNCKHDTCGHCAQRHSSRDCPHKDDSAYPRKCALCGGKHEAWASSCLKRVQQREQVTAAQLSSSRWFDESTQTPVQKLNLNPPKVPTAPISNLNSPVNAAPSCSQANKQVPAQGLPKSVESALRDGSLAGIESTPVRTVKALKRRHSRASSKDALQETNANTTTKRLRPKATTKRAQAATSTVSSSAKAQAVAGSLNDLSTTSRTPDFTIFDDDQENGDQSLPTEYPDSAPMDEEL